jgi:prophage DNA circulation protein
MADLQPATWRGIEFFVDAIKFNTGRRVAIHEYPYRDKPWVEDLGMGLQEISFHAFLVGDDVAYQYEQLKQACEKYGHGELVHPRIGSLTVGLISSAFTETKNAGNVVECALTFVVTQTESSITLWPRTLGSTASGIASGAIDVNSAASGNFLSRARATIATGQAAVKSITSTTQGYVSEARRLVGDATSAVRSVQSVAGQFGIKINLGRYNSGLLGTLYTATRTVNSVQTGLSTVNRVNTGVTSAINTATRARATVERGGERIMGLVNRL